jgi:type IV secretion system protein VirB6
MFDIVHAAGALPGAMAALADSFDQVGQWIFFKLIFEFIDGEIIALRDNMLQRLTFWIGSVGMTLMIMWIMIQGYRIVTGQSRDSMMALVVNSLRSLLILLAATTLSFGSADIYLMMTDGVPKEIAGVVTGANSSPADSIDKGLTKMQAAMAAIEALPTLENPNIKADMDKASFLTAVGVAGPAVVGGALLLMYKVAMALFVGLGPLFILSLLFEQTKGMFSRWLYYGIGTMFSMAVLSFMVSVSMKIVGAVAAATAGQYLIAMGLRGTGIDVGSPSVTTMAMQQGGLGMVLTVLLVTIPPMAASFFQGALGSFMHYSVFGANAAAGNKPDASGRAPGSAGYQAQAPVRAQDTQTQQDPGGLKNLGSSQGVPPKVTESQNDQIKNSSLKGVGSDQALASDGVVGKQVKNNSGNNPAGG